MICVYCKDRDERALALISMSRRSAELDAGVVYLGSPTSCSETRSAVRRVHRDELPCLHFKPLELPSACSAESARAIGEAVGQAVLDIATTACPTVVWIEGPAPPDQMGCADVQRFYARLLEEVRRVPVATVVTALGFADLRPVELCALLAAARVVINASVLIPRSPPWLFGRNESGDWTPLAGLPACSPEHEVMADMLQSEKLAALGQLAAGVAHELGNPLSIISSSLQYLHQRLAAAQDPSADFSLTALENVERMQGLLRGMLDFAALKKPQAASHGPVDLNQCVSQVVRFISNELARRDIRVDMRLDPLLPLVRGDRGAINQILLNLAKNALDALAERGGTLTARTRASSDRSSVIVEVENDGPPIPSEILPVLFRPFQTTKHFGTGLGLYLSRQIAKEHGGDLAAANLHGAVRFTLALPCNQEGRDARG